MTDSLPFIIASNNMKKIEELSSLLSNLNIPTCSLQDAGIIAVPEENGCSFEENALIKAKEISRISTLPAIADDSGLVVAALNGEPGIHSARYGAPLCSNDTERNDFLLKNMKNKEQRTAKFVSCIVCAFTNGDIITAYGECHGEIARESSGTHGFGYDPIFFLPHMNKTMAELPSDVKNAISHRALALSEFSHKLTEYMMNRRLLSNAE